MIFSSISLVHLSGFWEREREKRCPRAAKGGREEGGLIGLMSPGSTGERLWGCSCWDGGRRLARDNQGREKALMSLWFHSQSGGGGGGSRVKSAARYKNVFPPSPFFLPACVCV